MISVDMVVGRPVRWRFVGGNIPINCLFVLTSFRLIEDSITLQRIVQIMLL